MGRIVEISFIHISRLTGRPASSALNQTASSDACIVYRRRHTSTVAVLSMLVLIYVGIDIDLWYRLTVHTRLLSFCKSTRSTPKVIKLHAGHYVIT